MAGGDLLSNPKDFPDVVVGLRGYTLTHRLTHETAAPTKDERGRFELRSRGYAKNSASEKNVDSMVRTIRWTGAQRRTLAFGNIPMTG